MLLSGFVFYGLFFGIIRIIGNLAGVIIGAVLASRTYLFVYAYLEPYMFGYENFGKIVSFFLAFTVIRKIIVLLFAILDKTFNIISIIPFLTTINRIGGAALGLIEGTLIIGLTLFVASRYTIITSWFGEWLTTSQITPILIEASSFLLPLLSEALRGLNSII